MLHDVGRCHRHIKIMRGDGLKKMENWIICGILCVLFIFSTNRNDDV
jgi:hypothetical protein